MAIAPSPPHSLTTTTNIIFDQPPTSPNYQPEHQPNSDDEIWEEISVWDRFAVPERRYDI